MLIGGQQGRLRWKGELAEPPPLPCVFGVWQGTFSESEISVSTHSWFRCQIRLWQSWSGNPNAEDRNWWTSSSQSWFIYKWIAGIWGWTCRLRGEAWAREGSQAVWDFCGRETKLRVSPEIWKQQVEVEAVVRVRKEKKMWNRQVKHKV